MSLASAIAERGSFLATYGKNVLNIKFPKEFELYVLALELTDADFNTLRYFVFPINPSSLEESKPQLDNVKKTLHGISVLRTPTFVPKDILLNGTFGRSFKVLLGDTYEDFIHSFQVQLGDATFPTGSSIGAGLKEVFDSRIKTGYGCLKIMEEIIDQSKQFGKDGRPLKLIFHNPALGNSYLVSAGNLRMFQNEQTNMIWNYQLQLRAIAPLEKVMMYRQDKKHPAHELQVTNYIQKRVNGLVNTVSKLLGNAIG